MIHVPLVLTINKEAILKGVNDALGLVDGVTSINVDPSNVGVRPLTEGVYFWVEYTLPSGKVGHLKLVSSLRMGSLHHGLANEVQLIFELQLP